MKNIVVIGAGAAGMMASYIASINGANVTLIEKNEKSGKKIYITGKGRCNLTNDCDPTTFFDNIVSNPKFMYSAYYGFDNNMVYSLFEENGCKLKVERGNRVFPESDHASDVIKTLNKLLETANVKKIVNETVTDIEANKVYTKNKVYDCDSVIIATGGITYPGTGSSGDGYKFAKKLGHTIVEPRCALVPFNVKDNDVISMQGLSLKNVSITLFANDKNIYSGFGEMLFTHFGISGPLILTASSYFVKKKYDNAYILLDLKPALTFEELDNRILRDFDEFKNKSFKNSLDKLLPQKMIPVIVKRSEINPEKKVNEITKEERLKLCNIIKNFKINIINTRDVNEAIITQGGISVKEINPSTMESKLVKGVYFAGEIIDVDALTGGFNLQVAWSTGYLAGLSASKEN